MLGSDESDISTIWPQSEVQAEPTRRSKIVGCMWHRIDPPQKVKRPEHLRYY